MYGKRAAFAMGGGAGNHFVDALLVDTKPALTGQQRMMIQRFADAAHKSAPSGKEAVLDELFE
ncbi:MAG: hypothetical protein ACXADS_08520 [Candidatus Thorarchaeota archaeon]|jgi:membrane protein involved in colicin uptake